MVSFEQKQPPPTGGVKMVKKSPIILTQNLLEWLGYKGTIFKKHWNTEK